MKLTSLILVTIFATTLTACKKDDLPKPQKPADIGQTQPVSDHEFGNIIKSIMVKLPKGENDKNASYMLPWDEVSKKYFKSDNCFMDCSGNMEGSLLFDNKKTKPDDWKFEANGVSGGAFDFKFIGNLPENSKNEDILSSLKKSGIGFRPVECSGDSDFLQANNVNIAAGIESEPVYYYRITLGGYADALLVTNIQDFDLDKNVVRYYTNFSAIKDICSGGYELK